MIINKVKSMYSVIKISTIMTTFGYKKLIKLHVFCEFVFMIGIPLQSEIYNPKDQIGMALVCIMLTNV